jgi:hypothetical protein
MRVTALEADRMDEFLSPLEAYAIIERDELIDDFTDVLG